MRWSELEREYYFHAGAVQQPGKWIIWSDRTHRTMAGALREADRLVRRHGGQPAIEYWRRQFGLRPRDAGVVAGTLYPIGKIVEGACMVETYPKEEQ